MVGTCKGNIHDFSKLRGCGVLNYFLSLEAVLLFISVSVYAAKPTLMVGKRNENGVTGSDGAK